MTLVVEEAPVLMILPGYHEPPAVADRLAVRDGPVSRYLVAGIYNGDRLQAASYSSNQTSVCGDRGNAYVDSRYHRDVQVPVLYEGTKHEV